MEIHEKDCKTLEGTIYIITLHDINNPGSSLQAYALHRFLLDKGLKNKIVDYKPNYSKIGKSKLRGLIRRILFYKNEHMTDKKYSRFIKNYMLLTEKCTEVESVYQIVSDGASVIVGSDQLWNTDYDCGNDEAFYLPKVCQKRISYATSVGKQSISVNQMETLARKIDGFAYLSVREKSTAEMLSTFMKRNVQWVCDPVFLLDEKVYADMCLTQKKVREQYAVVYMSEASELLEDVIRYVKGKGYKIVQLDGNRKRCSCDYHMPSIGPEDFLTYIKDAELVISSSFHATCFSLIFEKNFLVIPPKNNAERIYSILALTNNMHKIVKESGKIEAALLFQDTLLTKERLDEYKRNSEKYLLESVRG